MHIHIKEHFRPYSHQPGTLCLIPLSNLALEVFPCLLRLFRWDGPAPLLLKEYRLNLKGPFKNFTIQQDLDRGLIRVWGKDQAGFFRYSIRVCPEEKKLSLINEKNLPSRMFLFEAENKQSTSGQSVCLLETNAIGNESFSPSKERLFLGNHKSQDWDLIRRRIDLTEILPCWSRLGQWIPPQKEGKEVEGGTWDLMRLCHQKRDNGRPEEVVPAFQQLFQAAFHGILVPFWEDSFYQGIISHPCASHGHSPLRLLTEGWGLMRRLFLEQKGSIFSILPFLPPEFHCGRLTGLEAPQRGVLDLEWTKKTIRRLTFYSIQDQAVIFHFKKIARFRLRKDKEQKGLWFSSGDELHLEKNCYYFFDNFS